jgi:hypothetical protein
MIRKESSDVAGLIDKNSIMYPSELPNSDYIVDTMGSSIAQNEEK